MTVAENRSELGDRLGQAIRQKPGSRSFRRYNNSIVIKYAYSIDRL